MCSSLLLIVPWMASPSRWIVVSDQHSDAHCAKLSVSDRKYVWQWADHRRGADRCATWCLYSVGRRFFYCRCDVYAEDQPNGNAPPCGLSTSSVVKTLSLTNVGATALILNKVSIAGTDPSDFVQTNGCPASLNPKATCAISVSFHPTSTGSRSALLVLTDNAQNSPQIILLSGPGD
jgi:hypothetical protein